MCHKCIPQLPRAKVFYFNATMEMGNSICKAHAISTRSAKVMNPFCYLQAAKKLLHIPVALSDKPETSQEEQILEPTSPAAAATAEQVLVPQPAVVESKASEEELVLEPASPAAFISYEQPAISDAAVQASEPSEEELVLEPLPPAATVIDQQLTSSQPAASEDAASPVIKAAEQVSPLHRRFACKTSPAAAAGITRSQK